MTENDIGSKLVVALLRAYDALIVISNAKPGSPEMGSIEQFGEAIREIHRFLAVERRDDGHADSYRSSLGPPRQRY